MWATAIFCMDLPPVSPYSSSHYFDQTRVPAAIIELASLACLPSPFTFQNAPTLSAEPPPAKKLPLLAILKYGASLGILAILVFKYRDQFIQFVDTPIKYHWLGLALVTMLLAFLTSYIRWQQLASAIGLELRIPEAIELGFIGSFFNIVTIGVVGGDGLRAYYASRHSPDRIPEAILSVFIDRVIGLIVMCGFAAVAFAYNGVPGDDSIQKNAIEYGCTFAGVASAAGCIALLVMLFVPNLKNWKVARLALAIPKLGPLFERIMDAAVLYSHRKSVIVKAILFSILTNTMFGVTIFLVGHSITQSPPTLADHFVIAPISMVANSLPLPGGIGGMEAALAYLYTCFGSDGGFLVALGFRLCILSISLIGWVVWLRTSRELKTPAVEPVHSDA